MNDWEKFEEISLKKIENFYSNLTLEKIENLTTIVQKKLGIFSV